MTTIRTTNNPGMLVWAREEVGYTLEQAAAALGLPLDSLALAEAGKRPLTLNQLRKAAELYDCPFGYFYFAEPPHRKTYKPVPDFRIDPGIVGRAHFRLQLEIKKVRDRRDVFLDLAERLELDIKPFRPLEVERRTDAASAVRARLGINDAEISALNFDDAYAFWKAKIESDGILVYESQYVPKESGVLGVALYYDVAPIILVRRGGDINPRKLFTLLHEYAHLLMGVSAINDAAAQTIEQGASAQSHIEAECNRLAADILVPPDRIRPADYKDLGPEAKMEQLARTFKVTYTTAAVCLKRVDLVTRQEFTQLLDLRQKAHAAKQRGNAGDVKIPRETIVRLDVGRPLFNAVLGAYGAGILDVFDASKILNLRVNKIERLASGRGA